MAQSLAEIDRKFGADRKEDDENNGEQQDTNSTNTKGDDDGKWNTDTLLQVENRSSETSGEEIPHLGQVAEYCFPMSIVVKIDAEKRWQRSYYGTSSKCYYGPDDKSYYDTTGKKGMLCILQHDDSKWQAGNDKDKTALVEFFQKTLNFEISNWQAYSVLKNGIFARKNLHELYCLVIFISAHGNEKGIDTDEGLKASNEITKEFSNEELKSLAGVPKIFILDFCRGKDFNSSVGPSEKGPVVAPLPTKSSDCLVILSTTQGYVSVINEKGSVGLQGVMTALKANWGKDHLEEMLIDARKEVAAFNTKIKEQPYRQTLEIQTTLLHRLKLMKC